MGQSNGSGPFALVSWSAQPFSRTAYDLTQFRGGRARGRDRIYPKFREKKHAEDGKRPENPFLALSRNFLHRSGMDLTSLAAKNKRIQEWMRELEEEVEDPDLRDEMKRGIVRLRG